MYELNRVLLQSVGPKGARYEDVLLDFRDQATDPARASILFLENGGGKSVLLKLLFSVVLAGRKYVVGSNSTTKTLENFVLSHDTCHVVLEWRRVEADGTALSELLLTGKTYEWRNLQHSSDSRNLREAWWTLRPHVDAMTLDTLPTQHDGRKRRLTSFREHLDQTNRAHPQLDLVWTDVQRKWHKHLEDLGLDPELFKYQRDMNADEGDADEVFAFRSHEAFVDFLLKAVTDREGPTELASNVDLYGEKLRSRERLQLEQIFVDGALDRLRPLAEAAECRDDAERTLRETERRGEDTHAQLAAATAVAARDHDRLTERADSEERRARTLATRTRELQEQLAELRRREADFRLAAAETTLTAAKGEHCEAHLALDAWRATEKLSAYRTAAADAKRLAGLLADAERDAQPLMARRTAAARRYGGALLALIDAARDAAALADRAAERDETTAGDHDRDARADAARAERLRAEVDAAQQRLDAIAAERTALIDAKLLVRGQTTDDALAALDERQSEAERRHGEASQRVTVIDGRRQELVDEAAAATLKAQRETDAAERIDADHGALHDRAHQLAAQTRLLNVAGVEHIDLWQMAERLLQAMTDAVAHGERDLILLGLDAAEDQHAAAALEATGRLPAARDAQQAVDALRGAGLSAVTGWEYLAESVRTDRRAAVLRRLPELIGGVVLTNAAHRERAEALLADSELAPTTVVALGDSGELDAAAATQGRERFIVEPNPALYDDEAGEEERQLRAERLTAVADQRRELTARYRADQQLRHDLDAFLTECPAGHLHALSEAAAAHRGAASEAKAAAHAAQQEGASLANERRERIAAGDAAQSELRAIAAARPRLEGLRDRARGERELRDAVRDGAKAAEEASESAETHAQSAGRLRIAVTEANRLADDKRREAERLGDELRAVEGAGDDLQREPTDTPLDELRGDYRLATRLLEQATTDSEIAADHRRAEETAADARAEVEEHPDEVRERAAALLAEVTDRTARREGERRAARAAATADDTLATARAERDSRQRELDRVARRDESGRGPRAQLTGELVPGDLEHAVALQARLGADLVRAQEDQRAAGETARQARDHASTAKSRSEVLSVAAESVVQALASAGSDYDPDQAVAAATAYQGSTDEARTLVRDVTQQLSRADADRDAAEERVRGLADKVTRYALDDAFEGMSGNLRDRLGRSELAPLARDADALVPHLDARLQEIARELASIEKHRSVLVQRYAALVQAALSTLQRAGRESRLPADLGDWSGKQFLRIDFTAPDNEDVLLERLGEVLDGTVGESGDRDGMSLLLGGVHAAAHPRGFRVTVLKPDTVLRDDRVDVTSMGEFSGGQRLTAAIALYCTLARMRSSSRGRSQPRAGVLFLDNPIGTASAEYLLDIQLKVAERGGVQLVYTTGVFDTNALSKFPCVLRLRNDLDMRAGMQHIRVAEPLRRALVNGHDPTDDAGYLDVARVVHQHDETTPA